LQEYIPYYLQELIKKKGDIDGQYWNVARTWSPQLNEVIEALENITPEIITPQTPLPKGQFVRVTVKEEGKRARTFWAKVDTRGKRVNVYIPVNKEGTDYGYYKGETVILPKELISHDLIVKEQLAEMNKTYGELEVIREVPKLQAAISKAESSSMLKYQFSTMLDQLILLQLHAEDPNCPCSLKGARQSELGEFCEPKHLRAVVALARETIPMDEDKARIDYLEELVLEGTQLLSKMEDKLCGKEVEIKEYATWARDKRKSLEMWCYSGFCEIEPVEELTEQAGVKYITWKEFQALPTFDLIEPAVTYPYDYRKKCDPFTKDGYLSVAAIYNMSAWASWKSSSLDKREMAIARAIDALPLYELMRLNDGRRSNQPALFPIRLLKSPVDELVEYIKSKEAEMAKGKRLSDLHSWAASGESYLKDWLGWQYLPNELIPLTGQAADALHDLASFLGRYMKAEMGEYNKGNILSLRTLRGYDKVSIDEVLTHFEPPAYHFSILEGPGKGQAGVIPGHWLETFSGKGLVAILKQEFPYARQIPVSIDVFKTTIAKHYRPSSDFHKNSIRTVKPLREVLVVMGCLKKDKWEPDISICTPKPTVLKTIVPNTKEYLDEVEHLKLVHPEVKIVYKEKQIGVEPKVSEAEQSELTEIEKALKEIGE